MSKFKDNVPGFPGYHVTKDGEVYSMKCRSGKRPKAFKLKPRLSGNGYYRIGLYKDGIKYERRLNRLVAMIYIPNPDNLDLEDLKRIRKVIRKAIKEHENNKSV